MSAHNDHQATVSAWLAHANVASSEQLARAFEQAFQAIWSRAHLTLGEVTLTAIVDRVLYNAAEQFPVLSSLTVEAEGPRWQELRERAPKVHRDELRAAVQFVLVEFLTVLGSLTAEILTPALHAELSKVVLEQVTGSESRDVGTKS